MSVSDGFNLWVGKSLAELAIAAAIFLGLVVFFSVWKRR